MAASGWVGDDRWGDGNVDGSFAVEERAGVIGVAFAASAIIYLGFFDMLDLAQVLDHEEPLPHPARDQVQWVTYYIALPFIRAEDGTIAPGEAIECRNAGAAILRAKILSRVQGNVGAIVSETGGPDVGKFEDAVALKRFGDVPSDMTMLFWSAGMRDLAQVPSSRLCRKFCDRPDAANLGCGEVHFVAGVHVGREAVLYFVLVDMGRSADCTDSSGWRMLKSNLAIDVIKLDDPTLVLIFLSRSPPTDDGDGRRAGQTDLRKCHDDLPKFGGEQQLGNRTIGSRCRAPSSEAIWTDDPIIKTELLDLTSVCEEVANNIEDHLTGK
jgi:hypothetical protein